MTKVEIIDRLQTLAKHAVHVVGESPFIMSLDDGIALHEAIDLLQMQEPHIITEADFEKADAFGAIPAWVEYLPAIPGEPQWVIITKSALDHTMKRYWSSEPTDEQRQAVKWE